MAVGFPTKVDYATGDVLSATNMNDLSGTVNLLESAQYAAGKNKIINGDFGVNQKNFVSATTVGVGQDMWTLSTTDGTTTYSVQTFTPGAAPVPGYESKNFAQLVSTGQTATNALSALNQAIEDVRTFAGETITVSFWAKAASGTPNITVFGLQNFGTGGGASSAVFVSANNKQATSTSWARYSFQLAIPSISGKTISGGNDLLRLFICISAGTDRNSYTNSLGIQSATIGIWGVQAEAASTASEFQTATGTKQGELAACQRYYWRSTNNVASTMFSLGAAYSTTAAQYFIKFPISMRAYPSAIDYSNLNIQDIGTGTLTAPSAVAINTGTPEGVQILATGGSGFTQYRPYGLTSPNSTATSYVGFSAEL